MTATPPLPPPSVVVVRPTRRAERAAASRQRLIAAASRLFARQGYASTSVAAIGDEAGVSRGLVNFHFATKENLLRAVIVDLVKGLENLMFPANTPAGPIEALSSLVQAHQRFLVDQPEKARLLFRLQAEALNPDLGLDAFAELHERWLQLTRPWWEEALAKGLLDPDLDHNAVTTMTIGALRGIALEWLLAPSAVDLDAAYGHVLHFLKAGLRPREGC
jgi:AcrR family transcriptional regulator